MQYLLYYVVCFKVRSTTREVFVADAMEATLANYKIFTHRHAHDVEVASTQYKKATRIPSPFNSDTYNP